MFNTVDIIEELSKERQRIEANEDSFLNSAMNLLNESYYQEAEIISRLSGRNSTDQYHLTPEQFDLLDYGLMFKEDVVQSICTKYRLRFLDSTLFIGTIPHEATLKIKHVEAQLGQKFKSFKVLAPESRFKLADSTEDPILFASLGNDTYYMIHKWGDEMSWYRNAIHFPFRNITTLAFSCVAIAMLINVFIPIDFFNPLGAKSVIHAMVMKAFFGFMLSGFFFTTALIFGILTSKEFSQDAWNSKYFN